MARTYAARPTTDGPVSTMQIRLALEADADRLADLADAALAEFYRLEALTAEARETWRLLALQRAAVEQTLVDLPDTVPTTATPAAAQAS